MLIDDEALELIRASLADGSTTKAAVCRAYKVSRTTLHESLKRTTDGSKI